jgi:hypothetical protein
MVRKRTRKYESDDNDSDSDLDLSLDCSSQPAAKKYSLRERKRAPLFTTDFDYYSLDDEDGEVRKQSSEDEDFEIEADVSSTRTYFEPETDSQHPGGLIDFEDIIRADIVVNKHKIDYDNIIQKTEIKLTQPKKRGRKPKNQIGIDKTENSSYICEPDLNMLTHLESQDSEINTEESQQDKQKEKTVWPEVNGEGQDDPFGSGCLENLDKPEEESDPLVIKNDNNIEMVMLKPPPIHENEIKVLEDEDDDVIVLGEVKQDVNILYD